MGTVSVRYIVHEVQAAIAFYTGHLGFTGSGGAARAMPNGRTPEPGGWRG